MYGNYDSICVKGIAATAPKNVVDNVECVALVDDKRLKRQVKLTGIKRRHLVCEKQSASDLATMAAEKLLNKLNWERDSIRVLVFITQSEDLRTPATAMLIQHRLGIGEDCLVFDVNLGCTAYTSGLQIISGILSNTKGRGLLLTGDGQYYEKTGAVTTDGLLFGDGGTATALEYEEGNTMLYAQKTDGSRVSSLYSTHDGGIHMDGNAVLLFSLNEVANSVCEFKNHFDIKEEQIDFYGFHQAQKIIIDGLARTCEIADEKILRSYEEFANTSSATIPLTLCAEVNKLKSKKKVKLYLCGYGVGLAWSSVVLDIDTDNILPLELSDYYYPDKEELLNGRNS